MSTPDFNKFIAGVILFEETLTQMTSKGLPFAKWLQEMGVVPGIKVDKGLINLDNTQDEQLTQGLDGLAERLVQYRAAGARFAKWRAVYAVTDSLPSQLAIHANAEALARYAAICQTQGIVPIVEPEVLIDGNHTIERCEVVTEAVLHAVFAALARYKVTLEYIVLKPSMVIAGKACPQKASVADVAERTVRVLRRTVPSAVPTINFLSGGQTTQEATAHLNAMNQMHHLPWNLSFSYARALQQDAMSVWRGQDHTLAQAQQAFYKRMRLNSLATSGAYQESMEQDLTALSA